MEIIGHKKIISFFENLIAGDSLSQAYCFVGKDSVGKRTVARFLASRLLRLEDVKLDTHPDFYYVSRATDEKTGKLKKEISIVQARHIKQQLGGRSWFGGYQVVIIDEAELLNEESGSALLKILEEPVQKRVFFLITSDDSQLLSTIKSRCQSIYFSLVANVEIEQGLQRAGYAAQIITEAVALSWGRPGRAIEMVKNEEARAAAQAELSRWPQLVTEPFYKKIMAMEDLLADEEKNKAGNMRTSEKLQNVLETWQIIWREVLLDKILGKENKILAKQDFSMVQIVAMVDAFKQSHVLLGENVNPKLVVEQILLQVE
jgi:DNA polymerase-3 subunit delta'